MPLLPIRIIPNRRQKHRSRKSTFVALWILSACFLYIISFLTEPYNYNYDEEGGGGGGGGNFIPGGHRLLRAAEPLLTGLSGHVFKVHGDARHKGITWYNVLSTPRLQWNMAPYHWKNCPLGEDVFLGETSFTFHEPMDPQVAAADAVAGGGGGEDSSSPHPAASMMISKYLRFRLERRDDRSCLWNYSKSCLAGGNFVMNFGREARDVLHPGDYTLKTAADGGMIRIVAYNTNRACSRKGEGHGPAAAGVVIANEGREEKQGGGGKEREGEKRQEQTDIIKAGEQLKQQQPRLDVATASPLDYLKQARSSTLDPEKCGVWIKDREANDDLFSYNSDMATVHIDTPWTQIIIQVRQNKVATPDTCNYANMNVWIMDMSTGLLEERGESDGSGSGVGAAALVGGGDGGTPGESSMKSRALEAKDAVVHVVDGPFGT